MKKLMMAAFAVAMAYAGESSQTDVYDIRVSARTPYISAGVREYRTEVFKGQLELGWDDAGVLVTTNCWMEQVKTGMMREYEVVFPIAPTVVGRKYTKANACIMLKADDMELAVGVLGTFARVRKGTGSSCCVVGVPECWKVTSVSGNVVGWYDCGCGGVSPTKVLGECGYDDDLSSDRAAMFGTVTIKFNKKQSDY